jgi:rsbT antagonist protein RsbS
MSKTNNSVPINIIRNILVVSLPLDLTDHEIDTLQMKILSKLNKKDLNGLILDLGNIDIIDSFFARAIADTAQMVNIMGFRTIVCGMKPSVAITTVELGFEFGNVEFAFDVNRASSLLDL